MKPQFPTERQHPPPLFAYNAGVKLFKPHWVIRLIVIVGVGVATFLLLSPSWLRARPSGDPLAAESAVIMGFGFERDALGNMTAGAANRFLLSWVLDRYPHVETIFAQEGVWVSLCDRAATTCQIGEVTLYRIDRHDDTVDLHSMDIAVCALERMADFDKQRAILVAHDMQLWRAAENMERAIPEICPSCEVIIPNVPDTPYPIRSEQIRTRYERLYILIDLIARTRDALFPNKIPGTCPMPMSPGE